MDLLTSFDEPAFNENFKQIPHKAIVLSQLYFIRK